MNAKNWTDEEILTALHRFAKNKENQSKEEIIKQIYLGNRFWKNIFSLTGKYHASDDFQEVKNRTLIELNKKLDEGKKIEIQKNLSAYLFGIAKNKLFKIFDERKRLTKIRAGLKEKLKENFTKTESEILTERIKKLIKEARKQLTEKCQKLLEYKELGFAGEVIKARMNYGAGTNVRAKIADCQQRLRAIMSQNETLRKRFPILKIEFEKLKK